MYRVWSASALVKGGKVRWDEPREERARAAREWTWESVVGERANQRRTSFWVNWDVGMWVGWKPEAENGDVEVLVEDGWVEIEFRGGWHVVGLSESDRNERIAQKYTTSRVVWISTTYSKKSVAID